MPPRNSSRILQKVLLFYTIRILLQLQCRILRGCRQSSPQTVWRTGSPRYRLHSTLRYRQKYRYRDWIYIIQWWWTQRRWYFSGIVTTRFIPDYPAAGTIFIEGKAIGRTNAPILTDGYNHILGIGTGANGVIDDDTGIGDLNGVEFGAKERFVPATIEPGPGLFDFTGTAPNRPISVFGYYGDDRDPEHIWYDHDLYRDRSNSLPRSYQDFCSSFLVLVHSLELSISEKPMLTMVLVLSTQSVGPQKSLWFVQLTGTLFVSGPYGAAEHTPHKLQRMLLPSHFLEMLKKLSLLPTNTLVLFTHLESTYNQNKISCCIWFSLRLREWCRIHHTCCLHLHSSCRHWCESANRPIQVFGYYGDDRDPGTSGTISIVGELTHPNIDFTPQSKVQVYSTSLENLLLFTESPQLSLVVLQHYLVLQTYRLPRANRHNSSELLGMEKLLSTLYMVTMETTRILVHLVIKQFLVLRYQKNPSIRILRRRQRSWNFRKTSTFFHDSCSSICRLHSISRWFWSIQDYWRSRNSPSFPTSTCDWIPLRYRIGRRCLMQDLPTSVSEISQSRRSHQQSSNVYNLKKVAHSLLSFNSIIFKSINKTEPKVRFMRFES